MRRLWLPLLLISVTGCGWYDDDKGIFVNREDDYIDTVERRPLIIPSDLAYGPSSPSPSIPPNSILRFDVDLLNFS